MLTTTKLQTFMSTRVNFPSWILTQRSMQLNYFTNWRFLVAS